MKKEELFRRTGCPEQLFGIQHYRFEGGKADNMRAIRVYNSTGLDMEILPDRGMDIASVKVKGVNVGFLSKTGLTASQYFAEDGGKGFMRSFYAGFLTTCGLTYMGTAGVDEGRELGQHGLISNIPAQILCADTEWEEAGPVIKVKGSVKQAEVFGEHIVLERTIRILVEENSFEIEDVIENRGLRQVPYMVLYHTNYGSPFLDESCILSLPTDEVTARDSWAAEGLDRWMKIDPPDDMTEEQCYYHKMRSDADGITHYNLINMEQGLAVLVSYDAEKLPFLTQWKCARSGEYVLGIEPGNNVVDGRAKAREDGSLRYLAPLEQTVNRLKFQFVTDPEAIKNLLNQCAN